LINSPAFPTSTFKDQIAYNLPYQRSSFYQDCAEQADGDSFQLTYLKFETHMNVWRLVIHDVSPHVHGEASQAT
jgi:hypothetical protein